MADTYALLPQPLGQPNLMNEYMYVAATSRSKRLLDEDDLNDQSNSKRSKKNRVKWTQELHDLFIEAVRELGGIDKAVPSQILQRMNVHGLTRENVASHLQKHRTQLREGTVCDTSNGHLKLPPTKKTSSPPVNVAQQRAYISNSPSPIQSPSNNYYAVPEDYASGHPERSDLDHQNLEQFAPMYAEQHLPVNRALQYMAPIAYGQLTTSPQFQHFQGQGCSCNVCGVRVSKDSSH